MKVPITYLDFFSYPQTSKNEFEAKVLALKNDPKAVTFVFEPERFDLEIIHSYKELLYYFPSAISLSESQEVFGLMIHHPEVNFESFAKFYMKQELLAVVVIGSSALHFDLENICLALMMLLTTNM